MRYLILALTLCGCVDAGASQPEQRERFRFDWQPPSVPHVAAAEQPAIDTRDAEIERLNALVASLQAQLAELQVQLQTKEPEPAKVPTRQVLYFGTTWCGPCQLVKPELDALNKKGWRVGDDPASHVVKIDGDARPDLVRQYRVAAYPTFLLLVDGAEAGRMTGYLDRWAIGRFYRGE